MLILAAPHGCAAEDGAFHVELVGRRPTHSMTADHERGMPKQCRPAPARQFAFMTNSPSIRVRGSAALNANQPGG